MKNNIELEPNADLLTTEIALVEWMKFNCYNFNNYSIKGNVIHEGYGLDKSGESFIWYYTERGQKNNILSFKSEEEAVVYAFNQISADKWAKSHCIGLTTSHSESMELASVLKILGIDFMQDKIPYYGPDRPMYRTFVFGCDIKKVEHLKEKYYKEG